MSKYILEVKFSEDFPEDLKPYYLNYKCNGEDSGIDLVVPDDVFPKISEVSTIDHKISCQLIRKSFVEGSRHVSYWLLPRSSISKTKFRMANSVGLIDSGYRGNLMAKIDTFPSYLPYNEGVETLNQHYKIEKGTRMFQIATGDLTPISEVRVVETLTDSKRGSGGFGSTG
jgi:dUTP pyrophosphatase